MTARRATAITDKQPSRTITAVQPKISAKNKADTSARQFKADVSAFILIITNQHSRRSIKMRLCAFMQLIHCLFCVKHKNSLRLIIAPGWCLVPCSKNFINIFGQSPSVSIGLSTRWEKRTPEGVLFLVINRTSL